MRSTFAGLSIAGSGLFAAQRALDVTGHNISNANTKGYSRQRLNQEAQNPMAIVGGQGQLGLGVKMKFISQVRDEMLDIKYRTEANTLGQWEERYSSLSQIEAIFNEPTQTGIRKVMDNFFEGLNALTMDPSSPTARAVFVQSTVATAQNFKHMTENFEKMIKDANEEVESSVRMINSIGEQIARINKQVLESELDGSRANDLRDARNLLIDDLSKLVTVQVREIPINNTDSSTLSVLIQGTPLVNHTETNKLILDTNKEHPMYIDGKDADPPRTDLKNISITNIKWSTGASLDQTKLQGTIGGQLLQRDGYKDEEKGIPYYIRFISEFTGEFAKTINEAHKKGYALGQTALSTDDLFTSDDTNPINAGNIRVNQVLLNDSTKLALGGISGGAKDDNKNAIAMLELRGKKDFKSEIVYTTAGKPNIVLGEGTPEDVIKTMISALGVDGQEAKRMFDNQKYLSEEIDSFRMSVSAVSQDEEMSNMIKFQHAYNAAARMITTVDEMIDVIINRMGRVGL